VTTTATAKIAKDYHILDNAHGDILHAGGHSTSCNVQKQNETTRSCPPSPSGKDSRGVRSIWMSTRTGKPWSKMEMWEAVARGPHKLATLPEAIEHFCHEAIAKVNAGQTISVKWDNIKNNPLPQLKISLIVAIPHKSKGFRPILDLSFNLRLSNGSMQLSVNDTTIKTAPRGASDQLGHLLEQ
jgi:hypothetical protein